MRIVFTSWLRFKGLPEGAQSVWGVKVERRSSRPPSIRTSWSPRAARTPVFCLPIMAEQSLAVILITAALTPAPISAPLAPRGPLA